MFCSQFSPLSNSSFPISTQNLYLKKNLMSRYGRLYNKKCDEMGFKVIGIKDNTTFLTYTSTFRNP